MAFISTVPNDFISRSGSNTVEAGYPGIPRSINMGIRVRLCSDWCLRGGGRFVRLSANICRLHRPNTIPIFCAAVCRDYRLRTCSGFYLYIVIYSLTIIASAGTGSDKLNRVLVYSSMKLIYAFAFSGRSSKVLQPDRSPKFPSNSLYTGLQLCRNFKFVEKSSVCTPLQSYAYADFDLVKFAGWCLKWFTEIPVSPFRRFAYFKGYEIRRTAASWSAAYGTVLMAKGHGCGRRSHLTARLRTALRRHGSE